MLIRKEEDNNVEWEDKLSQDPVPHFEIVRHLGYTATEFIKPCNNQL